MHINIDKIYTKKMSNAIFIERGWAEVNICYL